MARNTGTMRNAALLVTLVSNLISLASAAQPQQPEVNVGKTLFQAFTTMPCGDAMSCLPMLLIGCCGTCMIYMVLRRPSRLQDANLDSDAGEDDEVFNQQQKDLENMVRQKQEATSGPDMMVVGAGAVVFLGLLAWVLLSEDKGAGSGMYAKGKGKGGYSDDYDNAEEDNEEL